jgi:hypothetical protein
MYSSELQVICWKVERTRAVPTTEGIERDGRRDETAITAW